MGPVQIKPHPGSSWAPQKHPMRHRATYTGHAGVSYFFAAYNVHEDHLWMHHKPKKHASVVLTFLKAILRVSQGPTHLPRPRQSVDTHDRQDPAMVSANTTSPATDIEHVVALSEAHEIEEIAHEKNC